MKVRTFFLAVLISGIGSTWAWSDTVVQGATRFANMVELHAQQPGRVAQVSVTEADQVRQGDILMALENGIQAARVQVAEAAATGSASIQRGEVLLEQAQSRLKRIERAASRGGAPKWEVAEARLAVRAANAELTGAKEQAVANQARLQLERAGLEQYLVRAPFDAEVLEVGASVGTLADGRTPLLVLADRNDVEIITFLPAALAFSLEIGTSFQATLSAPVSRDTFATLAAIDPRIEPASGTVRAVFRLGAKALRVPSGIEVLITLPGTD